MDHHFGSEFRLIARFAYRAIHDALAYAQGLWQNVRNQRTSVCSRLLTSARPPSTDVVHLGDRLGTWDCSRKIAITLKTPPVATGPGFGEIA
jgi:hypothetical protein